MGADPVETLYEDLCQRLSLIRKHEAPFRGSRAASSSLFREGAAGPNLVARSPLERELLLGVSVAPEARGFSARG